MTTMNLKTAGRVGIEELGRCGIEAGTGGAGRVRLYDASKEIVASRKLLDYQNS